MCILLNSERCFLPVLTNDKNNRQALFNSANNVIRHTVKTSYCCDILFVAFYFVLTIQLSLSINQILVSILKEKNG